LFRLWLEVHLRGWLVRGWLVLGRLILGWLDDLAQPIVQRDGECRFPAPFEDELASIVSEAHQSQLFHDPAA
jgi:hypothetical protein